MEAGREADRTEGAPEETAGAGAAREEWRRRKWQGGKADKRVTAKAETQDGTARRAGGGGGADTRGRAASSRGIRLDRAKERYSGGVGGRRREAEPCGSGGAGAESRQEGCVTARWTGGSRQTGRDAGARQEVETD